MLVIESASLLSICGFTYDFNIIQRSEYCRQALSGDRVIVGDDNPDLWRASLDIIIAARLCHKRDFLAVGGFS
jgi:hypothetical protein